jgi:hypothetical protein
MHTYRLDVCPPTSRWNEGLPPMRTAGKEMYTDPHYERPGIQYTRAALACMVRPAFVIGVAYGVGAYGTHNWPSKAWRTDRPCTITLQGKEIAGRAMRSTREAAVGRKHVHRPRGLPLEMLVERNARRSEQKIQWSHERGLFGKRTRRLALAEHSRCGAYVLMRALPKQMKASLRPTQQKRYGACLIRVLTRGVRCGECGLTTVSRLDYTVHQDK